MRMNTNFLDALRADIARGVMPTIKAGTSGRAAVFAAAAISVIAATSPTTSSAFSLGDVADTVRDTRNVVWAGENAKRATDRVREGSSGRSRSMVLGDIEQAARSIDRAMKTGERSTKDVKGRLPAVGAEGPDVADAPRGGRPNSELFGPGY